MQENKENLSQIKITKNIKFLKIMREKRALKPL